MKYIGCQKNNRLYTMLLVTADNDQDLRIFVQIVFTATAMDS